MSSKSNMKMPWFMIILILSVITVIIYNVKSKNEVDVVKMFNDNKVNKQSKSRQEQHGIVVIITGSTSGIGKELARRLYELGGCTVVIASRSEQKCQDTIREIQQQQQTISDSKLDWSLLDTSDFDSVRDFTQWFQQKYGYLNYLVNCAGIHYATLLGPLFNPSVSTESKQGFDLSFATNYMGHFLLTHLLLPMISEGRVVNIASSYHFQSDAKSLLSLNESQPKASLRDIPNARFTHRSQAYGVSKLAQVMHAKELQRRMSDREGKVQSVSVCTGFVDTNMIPKDLIGSFVKIGAFFPSQGILAPLCAMFNEEVKGGDFITNMRLPTSAFPPLTDSLLELLALVNLRDIALDLLAVFIVMTQSLSYGFHREESSLESRNIVYSKNLYDWTFNELKKMGYINDN